MSRFAIQTIAWVNTSLEEILRDVTSAGYEGIELFQRDEELGGMDRLVEACRDHQIKIVGMCGGSFIERCEQVRKYCDKTGIRVNDQKNAPYVYCDEWKASDTKFAQALKSGLRIALHPHMYKPVQTMREADQILKANPFLLFLPDTAHLTIAGDDPVEAIRRYSTRLAAVHVKDWKEHVGRSFHFYARGFCELDQGNVPLDKVLNILAEGRHRGWIVIEQDTTPTPFESTKRSLDWLKEKVWKTRFRDPELLRGM